MSPNEVAASLQGTEPVSPPTGGPGSAARGRGGSGWHVCPLGVQACRETDSGAEPEPGRWWGTVTEDRGAGQASVDRLPSVAPDLRPRRSHLFGCPGASYQPRTQAPGARADLHLLLSWAAGGLRPGWGDAPTAGPPDAAPKPRPSPAPFPGGLQRPVWTAGHRGIS